MRDFSTNKFYFHDENRNVSFDSENKLGIVQRSILNKQLNYLATIKYFDTDDDEEQKRLDYAIDITFLGKNRLHIDKFDFFYNRRAPTLIVEQLVNEINKAIYPIEVTLNHEGFIDTINNLETIRERWKKTKTKIQREHKGNIVDLLLKKTDSELNKPISMAYAFAKDMFWSVFLHANTTSYGKKFETTQEIKFPFESYAMPLLFKGLGRLNKYTTEQGTIETAFEGLTALPKESPLYRNRKDSDLRSKLNIDTFLERETRLPIWIKTVCTAFDNEDRKNIKTIELSIAKQNK